MHSLQVLCNCQSVLTTLFICDKIMAGPGTTPITKNEDSVYSKGDDTHRKKRNCC